MTLSGSVTPSPNMGTGKKVEQPLATEARKEPRTQMPNGPMAQQRVATERLFEIRAATAGATMPRRGAGVLRVYHAKANGNAVETNTCVTLIESKKS